MQVQRKKKKIIFRKNKKEEFIGRAALEEQKRSGLTRKLVGFEMTAPGIARHGCAAIVGLIPILGNAGLRGQV